MNSNYEILGVASEATPEEIKAAYHAKLKEFPAHTYPREFKQIRTAYEALRKGGGAQFEDLFKVRPLQTELDPAILNQLQQQAMAQVEVSLDELIRLTF
ncbi:MAG: DnaJ domain-containing protein [Cyanothece sp. SIO1E1]|nr:DnaJ domain-containing protein [Cyanothece sp. SIO1E1]